MRAVVLFAALACAAPLVLESAHAEGSRESRYGPAPERAPTPQNARAGGYTGQPYTGRALGWSGKREMAPQAARTAPEAQQPWWARSAPQAPQPPQAPQARTAYTPQAPAYAPPARDLPRSIYDAPAPMAQYTPPMSAAPVPAAYAAPVQPAYRPQQQAALPPGQLGARTYSVGRQFGMTPDAIPAAGPPRMVLIAPPASAPEDDDRDKPRGDGDGDWSAKPHKDDQ